MCAIKSQQEKIFSKSLEDSRRYSLQHFKGNFKTYLDASNSTPISRFPLEIHVQKEHLCLTFTGKHAHMLARTGTFREEKERERDREGEGRDVERQRDARHSASEGRKRRSRDEVRVRLFETSQEDSVDRGRTRDKWRLSKGDARA